MSKKKKKKIISVKIKHRCVSKKHSKQQHEATWCGDCDAYLTKQAITGKLYAKQARKCLNQNDESRLDNQIATKRREDAQM